MIRIYSAEETLISDNEKDYDVADVAWLCKFHNNEPFVYLEGRLWEANEPY